MKKEISKYLEVIKTRNVLLLTLISFMYSLTFHNVIYALFLRGRGFNFTQIFLLETALSMAVFVFEVPSGYFADVFGRKKAIVLAASCYFISILLEAISFNYIAFVTAAVISGIGIASISGADSALIYESLAKDNKKEHADYAFSLISGAFSAALIIALPLGGLLAKYALVLPLYVSCIPLAIAPVIALFLEETSEKKGQKTKKSHGKKNDEKEAVSFVDTLKHLVLKQPQLLLLSVLNSITFVIVLSLHYLNQPLFLSYGINLKYFGLIMLATNFICMFMSFISPGLKRKLSTAKVLFISVIVPGFCILVLAKVSTPIIGLIALVGALSFKALGTPLIRTIMNENIPDSNRATALSVIGFIGSIVGMSAKPLVGRLVDSDMNNTFLILGSLMIVIAICFYFLLRETGNSKKAQTTELTDNIA